MLLLGAGTTCASRSSRRSTTSTSAIFEGRDVSAYRAWRAEHGPAEAVPGGESRLDALARYAAGCARLLARHDARCVLLVVHDIPIRFLRNALLRGRSARGPACAPSRTSSSSAWTRPSSARVWP